MLNIFRTLPKKHPQFFALLFGIILCIIFLFVLESFFYFLNKTKPDIETVYSKPFYRIDEFGLCSANPGEYKVATINNENNKVIWHVNYSIDEFGKRKTPIENEEGRDKFLLLFGCSFTFGVGLQNDQTLAYEIGQRTHKYRPYNFGFGGDGPFDALARVETTDFKSQIAEDTGIIIYVLPINVHLERIFGSLDVSRWNGPRAYYQKGKDGLLVRSGTFSEHRSFLKRLLLKSQILKYNNIKYLFSITENDIKFAALVINTFFAKFREKYSNAKVYILIYPWSKHKDLLVKYINKDYIKILDYTGLLDNYEPKYYLSEYDKHPSHLLNTILAEKIIKDLDLE
ncbi:MAG: hypothetical protein ABII90_13575 [Bacteroidota bacterium]